MVEIHFLFCYLEKEEGTGMDFFYGVYAVANVWKKIWDWIL
jgi:hypothetical protein